MLRSYLYPPDDDAMETDETDETDEPLNSGDFTNELRAVPELRASPAPYGYVPVNGDALISDADVAPIGEPKPVPTFPVIRQASAPDSKPYQNVPDYVAERNEQIPVPVPVVKSSIGAPTDIGPMPLNRLESNDLPADRLPGAFANRIIGQDKTLSGAMETARQTAAKYPVRPTPKWWERALAGAVGGAAGWSNAAGRAREIDPTKATNNILYPGYDQKLASWQSEMDKANKQVENLGQQVGAEYAARNAEYAAQKSRSDAMLKAAQTEMDIKHGDYWEKRSEQERNQWRMNPNGTLYNTITGQQVAKPDTPAARKAAAMAITHGDEQFSNYYAFGLKPPTPTQHNPTEWQAYMDANNNDSAAALRAKQRDQINRSLASGASLANYRNWEMGQGEDKEMRGINDKRNLAERQILGKMSSELATLTAPGRLYDAGRAAEIKAAAAIALTNMQKEYAAAIRGKGGQADEYEVDPQSMEWLPPGTLAARQNQGQQAQQTKAPAAKPATAPAAKPTAAVAPAAPRTGPVRVTLPNGSTKVFPDQKSLDAFAKAAGLTFTEAK